MSNEYITYNSNYIAPLAICFYATIISASITGQKLIGVFGLTVSAGNIILPFSYILIACITELYSFKKAKNIIFTGALCNFFISAYLYFVIKAPHAESWENNDIFSKVNLITSSVLFTSTIAYLVSEYIT